MTADQQICCRQASPTADLRRRRKQKGKKKKVKEEMKQDILTYDREFHMMEFQLIATIDYNSSHALLCKGKIVKDKAK